MSLGGFTPIDSRKAEELLAQGFESPNVDFKQEFDNSTGAWMELAKDVYAMSNYGGGFIVIGVEDGTFRPIGVNTTFHIDSQVWAERLSKWASPNIRLAYLEYEKQIGGQPRKFPILYIYGSISALVVPKVDGNYTTSHGQDKTAFQKGVIYTRKTTASVIATGEEFWKLFWALLKRTAEATGSTSTPLEVISVLKRKAEPDPIEEALWSNLFPVTELPDYIYTAETEYREAKEIYEKITKEFENVEEKPEIPAFFLANKKIYSFEQFNAANPLTRCIKQVQKPIATKSWLEDLSRVYDLTKLLNFNLKSLCRKKHFYYDKKRDRFFIRYFGAGGVPEVTWKPYKRQVTRRLVNIVVNKLGRLLYCEHFAGRLRFAVLGSNIYLIIEPSRVLTNNGESPLDQQLNIRISTKKNFQYHNNNYLYDLKLWLHILAGNRSEIHLGTESHRVVVSILPLTGKASFGIFEDQHTGEDFLDNLKSEPLEYQITFDDGEQDNPLTETSLED